MDSLSVKRILGRFYSFVPVQTPRRIIVLYHSIGSGPDALSQDLFRKQMQWLAANSDVLSIDNLLAGSGSRSIKVALTFDDGYESVLTHAAPVLKEMNSSATVYVNSGWIGNDRRRNSDSSKGHYSSEVFMTWQDLRSLTESGWTIGSHGVEHLDLTSLDDISALGELRNSKTAIENALGVECQHFAYTWGRYTKRLQEAVRTAGYKAAASSIHGRLSPGSDLFALPRIDIARSYSLDDFVSIVLGHWDFMGTVQRLRRVKQGLAW